MQISAQDRQRVSEAVTAAERDTDGEIVTIVARQSDGYTDVALHWAVLASFFVGALAAWYYPVIEWLYAPFADRWASSVPLDGLLTTLLLLMALVFLLMRVAMVSMAVRLALTPGFIEERRVRAKALALFRTSAEQRTAASTGVLLYVSLAERRAEIVAEAGIHERVAEDVWGEAMAALVTAMKDGRPGDGMADAVTQIGAVLAEHFPKSDGNPNELPDRLIEL
ncbi:TPM domain-containing protein [Stakelama sediminis]|uniref:Putative membrane protein n=1 Tax=Stakelama sediminis TaxID=463200 RepID=A0A840YX85_9SPHN|nr:putative membrane protein [Stakelama sediminis]